MSAEIIEMQQIKAAMEMALQLEEIEDAIEILREAGYFYPASILEDILAYYE